LRGPYPPSHVARDKRLPAVIYGDVLMFDLYRLLAAAAVSLEGFN
jgi:hypothetical protein